MLKKIAIQTNKRDEMLDITDEVQTFISEEEVSSGVVIVYCPHTTAGITINENADPDEVLYPYWKARVRRLIKGKRDDGKARNPD